MSRSVFFVPVYNQIEQLPVVLREIEAASLSDVDFLLVNNGCSDGSAELIHQSGHPHLDVERNRGAGYAYMLSVDWALERGERYEFFGSLAANGKMLPSEIPRLVEPLHAGRADYVSGSRFLERGHSPNLPTFRRLAIPMVGWFVQAVTGTNLTDPTNGFRAFALGPMQRAVFDWHAPWLYTYGFEYYLYAKFLFDPSLRCIEVPSTMRYPTEGPYTHIRPGTDWIAMLRPWVRARVDGKGFRPE